MWNNFWNHLFTYQWFNRSKSVESDCTYLFWTDSVLITVNISWFGSARLYVLVQKCLFSCIFHFNSCILLISGRSTKYTSTATITAYFHSERFSVNYFFRFGNSWQPKEGKSDEQEDCSNNSFFKYPYFSFPKVHLWVRALSWWNMFFLSSRSTRCPQYSPVNVLPYSK